VSRVWPSINSSSRMSELRQRSRASMISSRGSGMSGNLGHLHGGEAKHAHGTVPATIAEQLSRDVRDLDQV
jgi:hypothetical protein